MFCELPVATEPFLFFYMLKARSLKGILMFVIILGLLNAFLINLVNFIIPFMVIEMVLFDGLATIIEIILNR